jgi:hypothetical protein
VKTGKKTHSQTTWKFMVKCTVWFSLTPVSGTTPAIISLFMCLVTLSDFTSTVAIFHQETKKSSITISFYFLLRLCCSARLLLVPDCCLWSLPSPSRPFLLCSLASTWPQMSERIRPALRSKERARFSPFVLLSHLSDLPLFVSSTVTKDHICGCASLIFTLSSAG